MSDESDNVEKENNKEKNMDINNSNQTRIKASLGDIEVEVESDSTEDCDELFNSTWDKIMKDAEEMSDSMYERFNKL